MSIMDPTPTEELLRASDEEIRDAVTYADPMVLRGLLYQLTGDPEVKSAGTQLVRMGFALVNVPATDADKELLQRKASEFLIAYRDGKIEAVGAGPRERLGESLSLLTGAELDEDGVSVYAEELGLDPFVRSLKWQAEPDPERLKDFSVTIIGAGMGGLIAALELRRAGIPFTVIEKNSDVGGTWYENRYPGARVDTPSRGYAHIVGVDFPHPNAFCNWKDNLQYFNWFADH